jgi:Caspase domain
MVRLSLAVMLLWGLIGCATLLGPPVKVRDVRFFEQGPHEAASRKYQTQFEASRARYIAVELKLEYSAPGQVVELPMACRYINAEGRLIGESQWRHRLDPTSTGSSATAMTGWPTPGKWLPGTYRVECRAQGQRIATEAFDVVREAASRPAPPRESSPPAKPSGPPLPQPSAPPVAPPAPVAPSSPSQPRLALVIGNTAYPDSPLRNPANDATAIAALLRQLDFTVTLRLDADQPTMERAIQDFTSRVPRGSMGLFYFSGHGVQVEGFNYLIPIGGIFREPSDLRYHAVPADWVLARMDDAGMDMKVLILDACRDNPFGRNGTRTLRRGLAIMDAPRGSLIAYATSPGKTALDGAGPHSPYTAQLLRQIRVPGRPMELMFKAVREAVQRETNDQQTPWEASSVTGDFYFAGR